MTDVSKLDNINCFAQLIPLDLNQWVIILDLLLQQMYTDPSVKSEGHWLYSVFCSVATASCQHSVITVGCRGTSAIVQHFFPWKRLVESRYGLDTRLALYSCLLSVAWSIWNSGSTLQAGLACSFTVWRWKSGMELELGLCINIIKRLPVVAKFNALLTYLYYKTLHYKMISGLMMSSIPGMRVSGVQID